MNKIRKNVGARALMTKVLNKIPDKIEINTKPIKDYLLYGTEVHKKDVICFTYYDPKKMEYVIYFEDPVNNCWTY